jgi:integrase
MKITPILFSRKLSNGLFQVKIRIFNEGNSKYLNTGIEIEKNHWDSKMRRIKELKSIPNHEELNGKIQHLVNSLKKNPTIKKEDEEITQKQFSLVEFLIFFERQIDIQVAQKKYNTYRKNRVVLNHLKAFNSFNPISNYIDRQFLDDFKIYLFKEVKLKQNGFFSYFKVFRTYINKIIESNHPLFRAENNPFLYYKMKEDPVLKIKLTKEQFKLIEGMKIENNPTLERARNLFVFAYYSGGMRIADILTLQWRNIVGDRLEYRMRKTKKDISIPLNLKQLEIIYRYAPVLSDEEKTKKHISRTCWIGKDMNTSFSSPIYILQSTLESKKQVEKKDKNILNPNHPLIQNLANLKLTCPHEFIFPPMKGFKYHDSIQLDKKILSSTYCINRQLKKLSLLLDLGIDISTHIARHTLSDLMRKSGIGLYDISKILGHADIAVTQKYLNTLDRESVDSSYNSFYEND